MERCAISVVSPCMCVAEVSRCAYLRVRLARACSSARLGCVVTLADGEHVFESAATVVIVAAFMRYSFLATLLMA